jgi:hypothetical protein
MFSVAELELGWLVLLCVLLLFAIATSEISCRMTCEALVTTTLSKLDLTCKRTGFVICAFIPALRAASLSSSEAPKTELAEYSELTMKNLRALWHAYLLS